MDLASSNPLYLAAVFLKRVDLHFENDVILCLTVSTREIQNSKTLVKCKVFSFQRTIQR